MLDKTYSPADAEVRIYEEWERSGAFLANLASDAEPYCIMMPPPNVTGTLHMGHALTYSLQDILSRYYRMQGRDVLWQPGTDHAGIATQTVVERELAKEQKTRTGLGRAAFLERVWEWKAQSGATITNQLRRLGALPDWSRERFTLDEGLSRAVRKVFVQLYQSGLIYKDKRLVNWDPVLGTAISDLEVLQKEIDGHMWFIRYPLASNPQEYITVATTRPETLLGDTAVAVHPDDPRYRHLIGQKAVLPLADRLISIIADEYSDPSKGTGAVKITPAHDFNDFEVGRRHSLPLINILDRNAALNDQVPVAYHGLDRVTARKAVVEALEGLGLIEKIEKQRMMVPIGDRSGAIIEPWLTDQWYVNAATLAEPAIAAVRDGRTTFVPSHWSATYFEWMENIRPWCISRQLWWGHRIPAWYAEDGSVFVAETEEEAARDAEAKFGRAVSLRQDEDVLDTWFSSALWPFSTLGWPDYTGELKRYYPTTTLVSGFDIIFFWVARMMMMGLHFMEDVPFRTVYIHALVRDQHGQKMSKSKGNIIDPLELTDRYGADALRFTLAALAAPGRDIKISEARVAGYRNFATKIWNAARFCEMNGCRLNAAFDFAQLTLPLNQWIVSALASVAKSIDEAFAEFRFNEAAHALYHFIWHRFCDWYLELSKPVLTGTDEAGRAETQATASWVLSRILHLLHPLMPFVTEELHRQIGGQGLLIATKWPHFSEAMRAPGAEAEMEWLITTISAIRTMRAEMNVPPSERIPLYVADADPTAKNRIDLHRDALLRLGRLSTVSWGAPATLKDSVQIIIEGGRFIIPLQGLVDFDKERQRLIKEAGKLVREKEKILQKMNNSEFRNKAPQDIIDEQEERLAEITADEERLQVALERLGELA